MKCKTACSCFAQLQDTRDIPGPISPLLTFANKKAQLSCYAERMPKHSQRRRSRNRRSNMTTKSYGTVSPEQQKSMSGLEFVKGLASGALPLNTMAQTLGYDVVEAESGRVAITVTPTDAHLNP